MRVFVVYWHREPRSFNAAMFHTACETLTAAGNDVRISDLHEMRFDPVSSRKNFTTVKDSNYFKQQAEEVHANETKGFSKEIVSEIEKNRVVRFDDLAVPLMVVRTARSSKGLG